MFDFEHPKAKGQVLLYVIAGLLISVLAISFQDSLWVLVAGSAYLVGGVRYHTHGREENRKTQNNGIMVASFHNSEPFDFYGCLKEIIKLWYNLSGHGINKTVVLFHCDWYGHKHQ